MFSLFKKKKKEVTTKGVEVKAYISGNVIPIEEVADEVFSSKALGGGLAIEPEGNMVTAPCDGVVSLVMEDTIHAVGMTLTNGAEILIHEGIDTVNMNGDGFELFVSKGQRVSAGEPLFSFDADKILCKGLRTTCIFVLTNENDFTNVRYMTGMTAKQNETTIVWVE